MARIMEAQQFLDLPQIDEVPYWQAPHHIHTPSYGAHDVSFCVDDGIYVGDFDNGFVSMQRMQTWMSDKSTFTPGMPHAKLPFCGQSGQLHDQQWLMPDIYRNVSPDRTSASDLSSFATQSEHRSPQMHHPALYGSPTDFAQPWNPYPSTDHFPGGPYPSHLPILGTSIDPRDVEIEHREVESVLEDPEDPGISHQIACDHGQLDIKLEDATTHSNYADSGIGHSLRDAESVQPVDMCNEQASDSEYSPPGRSCKKRRRSSASDSSGRAVRRRKDSHVSTTSSVRKAAKKCRRTSNTTKAASENSSATDDRRPFPCPFAYYGCVSTFASKNEWKRHVSTQHIKVGYWRCDLCPTTTDASDECAPSYNDFNRKDLFTQHLRRMHAAPKDAGRKHKGYPVNEDNLPEHQKRCFTVLRTPPQESGCLFCERTFEGPASWEERIEHVGRHLEKDSGSEIDMLDYSTWNSDESLEQYLLGEGLIAHDSGRWRIGDGKPKRRPAYVKEDSDED